MRRGYVYILASKPYGTLYIGVTNNLSERVYAHRIGKGCNFTRKSKLRGSCGGRSIHLSSTPSNVKPA